MLAPIRNSSSNSSSNGSFRKLPYYMDAIGSGKRDNEAFYSVNKVASCCHNSGSSKQPANGLPASNSSSVGDCRQQ